MVRFVLPALMIVAGSADARPLPQDALAGALPQVMLTEPSPVTPAERYAFARARAIRERKPLVVWVSYPCLPCQQQLGECVHVNVEGPWAGVAGPAAVVGQYRDGELWRHDLTADYSPQAVRRVLGTAGPWMPSANAPICGPNGCPAGVCATPGACGLSGCAGGACAVPTYAPTYYPAYAPAFGGFTPFGGFGGRSCGPGGCR